MKFKKAINKALTISLLPLVMASFTGCKEEAITDDPISALNGLVKEYGFIGFENRFFFL